MATALLIPPARKSSKSTVVRKSTRKAPHVQAAIIVKRTNGESKSQIAKSLGVSRNTVASVLELSNVEQQIAQYRAETLEICPDAITAVHNQVKAGDGDLGLKLLERVGVIGEDAIDTVRRNSVRQSSAINILVQAGATVSVQNDNSTVTSNKQVTEQAGADAPSGKHPKDGVGH